jgi:hypothetical protein
MEARITTPAPHTRVPRKALILGTLRDVPDWVEIWQVVTGPQRQATQDVPYPTNGPRVLVGRRVVLSEKLQRLPAIGLALFLGCNFEADIPSNSPKKPGK